MENKNEIKQIELTSNEAEEFVAGVKNEMDALMSVIAVDDRLSPERQELASKLMSIIFLAAGQLYQVAPSLGEINIPAPEREVVKNNNVARCFIVTVDGISRLIAVRGVKDDEKFCKMWREKYPTIAVCNNPGIGFLHCSGSRDLKIYNAQFKTGENLLVYCANDKDAICMIEDARRHEHWDIPQGDYDVWPMDTLHDVHIMIAEKSMKEMHGGNFTAGDNELGSRFTKYSIVEFDDFRDAKHKEM